MIPNCPPSNTKKPMMFVRGQDIADGQSAEISAKLGDVYHIKEDTIQLTKYLM